jgi:hypothetical protein
MRLFTVTSGTILGLALCASSARAAVTIISDPLTGSGALNGSAPLVDTYNPTDTWNAYNGSATSYFTRGATNTTMTATNVQFLNGTANPAAPATADLMFSPTAGNLYTLTATFTLGTGTNGEWLPFGFTGVDSNTLTYSAASNGPWMLIRTTATNSGSQNAGDLQLFPTGTSSSQAVTGVNSGVTGSTETLSIVLDTTQPQWAASWYENGSQLGTTYTYPAGSNPTSISAVEFGEYWQASGSVANFSLTTVPEPASLSVMAIGAIGLLTRRRRVAKV